MALPLLLVALSSPILSLIDVAAVGRSAGVLQLASLGPATAVCDLSMYVFATLSIVTTRLAAAALVKDDACEAATKVSDGVLVAAAVGAVWGGVLLSPVAPALLNIFLPATVDARVLPMALAYTRIRALGFVAALATIVLQSSALVRRNLRLPLAAVAIGSLLNAAGDWWLVLRCGMGVRGAAWATVAAQVAACGVLARAELEYNAKKSATQQRRGVRDRVRGLTSFLALCVSPSLALIGKLSVVLTVSATASACGTISLAAHQVLNSVFQLFRPMGDSLGQTIQTLLPAVMANNDNNSYDSLEGIGDQHDAATTTTRGGAIVLSREAMSVLRVMCAAAVGLGVVDAVVGSAIPGLAPFLFTPDAVVAGQIARTAPLIGAVLLVHALSTTLEGVLFATGDAKAVAKIYTLNSVLVTLVFGAIRARGEPQLRLVWGSFLAYQVVRVSQFGLRLIWNQRDRRTIKKKRQIWRWLLKERLSGLQADAADLDGVVWSTSYEARKYSAMDYSV